MAKAKKSAKKSPAKKNKTTRASVSKSNPARKTAPKKGKAAITAPALAGSAAVTKMENKGNQELSHSGWVHQVRHESAQAEAEFRQSLQSGKSIYAQYGLAKALMDQGKKDEAVKNFEDVAHQLEAGALKEDKVRSDMLRRQCLGYVQRLKTGNWDLSNLGNALP